MFISTVPIVNINTPLHTLHLRSIFTITRLGTTRLVPLMDIMIHKSINYMFYFYHFLFLAVLHSAHYIRFSHAASWHETIVHSCEFGCVGPGLNSCERRCNGLATLLTDPITVLRWYFTCVSVRLCIPVCMNMNNFEKVRFSLTFFKLYLTLWTHSLTNTFTNLFWTLDALMQADIFNADYLFICGLT